MNTSDTTCLIAHRRTGLVHHKAMRTLLIATVMLLPSHGWAQAPAATVAQEMGTLIVESGVDGAVVRIDDVEVGRTPLPGPWTLTPGEHTIEVRPEDGAPIVRSFTIAAGQPTVLQVLGGTAARTPVPDTPTVEAPAPEALGAAGPGFDLATGGYIAAGLGVAVVGAGVALGLMADSAADDAFAATSRADQQTRIDTADAMAFGANVSYGAGGLLLLGGVAMIVLAADGPLGDAPVSVAPTPGGMVLGGRF